MKVDFKRESDGVWRAYVKTYKTYYDGSHPEDPEGHEHIWVPIATSNNKSLCIRNAKDAISKHIIKNYR
jgi:hypothetical protein